MKASSIFSFYNFSLEMCTPSPSITSFPNHRFRSSDYSGPRSPVLAPNSVLICTSIAISISLLITNFDSLLRPLSSPSRKASIQRGRPIVPLQGERSLHRRHRQSHRQATNEQEEIPRTVIIGSSSFYSWRGLRLTISQKQRSSVHNEIKVQLDYQHGEKKRDK
ncbi:hypothetical protein BT93_I1035 [Corymbia citriodora subsp. variegata]|nr:hypothetical protein BT93_I1035 [Corymbia citriodora subsp. variegata]